MKKVYIILLNYNGYNDTIECINSIKSNIDLNKFEIIVVDNNSTDNSYQKLKKVEGIILIKANQNNGFSAGNNIGIKYALKKCAEYVILLNNDTIVTKNCFDKMLNIMEENKDIGIMGNKVLYYSNKDIINTYGGGINFNRGTAMLGYENKYNTPDIPKFMDTEFICGCCMLIRKEVFEKIGYLPEEYFMYYEDVDFCVNASKFFRLSVCGDSEIYHKVSASSGGCKSEFSVKWNTRNRILFINKYCNKISTRTFFYLSRIIVFMKYLCAGKVSLCRAMIKGIVDGRGYLHECKKV